MKKTMFMLVFMLATLVANAQFEQGKWLINPSVTNLGLSYNKAEKSKFGLNAKGGAFVADNFALLIGLGANWQDNYDALSVGVGGRYYFNTVGIYLGAGFDITRYNNIGTHFELTPEVGYAFFITRTVTIEPAIYYRWNFKESDLSTIGLKIGFAIYF